MNTTNPSSIDKTVEQMPLPWLPLPITSSTLSDVAQQVVVSNNHVSPFDQEWQNLRYMPWRFFYLDYLHLNQEINSNGDEGDMVELIQLEWNKVYDFYMLKIGEIERKIESYYHIKQGEEQLKLILLDIHHLYHFSKLNYCGFLRLFMQYDRLFGSNNSDLLRRMLINKPFWDHSIVLFNLVSQLNYLFCIDLLYQPPSPITMLNPSESFFSAVESFQQQRKIIHPLSISPSSSSILSCKTALSHQEQELPKHSKKVKKYWVHPDNIIEVVLFLSSKKMILQNEENNPSFTFTAVDEIGHPQGLKSKLIAKSPTSIHHVPENTGGKKEINNNSKSKVTTVYLDTPNLNDYAERITKKQEGVCNTTATRVRWFNDKVEQQDGFSLLEEKVYYSKYQQKGDNNQKEGYKCLGKKPQKQEKILFTTEDEEHHWIKQRIWLKSKHLKSWINGNWSFSNTLDKSTCQYRIEGLPVIHAHDKQRMKNACLQTERDIHNKLKVPDITMMSPMDTLKETEIKMTKSNLRQNEHEQYPYYTTSSNDIHRFPFCLIQIESNNEQDIDWLMKLESSPLLESVHDFSLYLHGVGTLLSDQVHVFPTWLSKIEFLDIRQSTQRGNLFIQQQKEQEPVLESSNVSSGDEVHYWSSNTIATIVTCFDDEDEGYVKSSSSSISSLLSPIKPPHHQLQGKFRRSFDSYCSFDHPTSSKSDPTNCKSCMGRMINNSMNINNGNNNNADCPTLYSVVRDAFKYCFGQREGEKEPLLATHSHSTNYVSGDIETGNNNNTTTMISKYQNLKASITTAFLIVSSLSVSYLFYVSFINK